MRKVRSIISRRKKTWRVEEYFSLICFSFLFVIYIGIILHQIEGMMDENIALEMKNKYSPLKFFRFFLWYGFTEVYNWKSLAYSIYHLEHLINRLDNYQIKSFLQQHFPILSKHFASFLKNLITIQMSKSKKKYLTVNNTVSVFVFCLVTWRSHGEILPRWIKSRIFKII